MGRERRMETEKKIDLDWRTAVCKSMGAVSWQNTPNFPISMTSDY